MFNNLRIFKLKSDYTSKKGEFEYPTCSYVEEDDWVYFMEPVPTVKSFNVTLSYSTEVIDASGGTSTPIYSFSQEVEYDNGTSKTLTGSSSNPHSEAVVSWGGASNAHGLVSADTKGTVESEQTLVASPVISIALNGVVATATSSVYQAANAIVSTSTSGGEITYGNVTKGTITNATIPAKGSTTNYTATASNGSQTWTKSDIVTTYTYTSTATKDEVENGTSGTNVVTPSPSSLSATASTKGTITSNTTTITSTTVTWSGQGGESASDTMYVYQEANKVESSSGGEVTYGNVVPGTASVSQVIPASGGSATITATKGTQSKTTAAGVFHYTSEATASSSSDTVETIDVPYTISKSEVTAQTRSNVTGNQITIESVSVTWNGSDSKNATSSVTVYQQANSCTTNIEYTYGSITKGSFSNKTIAASGGSVTVSIGNGSQGRTGVTTSAYTSNVIETAQTVNDTVSVAPSVSSLSGNADNRGTVTGTQLTITSSTVTWSANGKSASDTVYIYQEANTRSTKSVNTVYSDINVGTITANPLSIEFEGGTSYVTATNGTQTWEEITTYSYTSKEESTAVTDSGSVVVTPTVNPTELVFEALDGGEEGPCLTSVATWSANGKSATASTTVCQSSKSVTGTGITYSYGTVTAGTITNATIPASGSSTSYSATIRNGSQNYTAYTHNYWSDGTDEIVSQTTGTTTISPSPSSLSATASTRGTTTGTQKTITSTTVTWASKDGTASKNKTATAYVYQQANEVTSTTTARTYSYGTVTAGTINTATIPASGGSGTTTIENGSQKYTAYTATTYYYTSKASNSANTNSSTSTTAATPNKTSLTASTSSRGTTTGSVQNITSTTITWTGGGSKTTTGTAYVKQAANTKTYSTSGVTQGSVSYGTVTAGTVTNKTIPASGSSTNYTATASNGSQSWTRTDTPWSSYTFTSTSTAKTNGTSYETTGTTTISPSPSSLSATASTRGTTTGTQKTITSTTVTWASKDGTASKNKTNTMYVYQEANAVTNSFYNTGITYNAPSVSIGSGIVASGGSATVTHSVTNTITYYYLYTSNATSSAKTSGRTGTSTIKITSNGNNRFSLSGNKLSHSDMTTNATTDTVTITATNADSTGKTATASKSITNTKTYSTSGVTYGSKTYATPSCGTITLSKSSVGAGESVTVTATIGNGTQSWTRTATPYSSYTYTSGDESTTNGTAYTDTGSTSVSCSVSPSTGFSFSNRGTTTGDTITKTFTGTCTANGKTCTTTKSVSQEANAITEYLAPTFDMWYPSGVGSSASPAPASGGTTSVPSYTVTQKAVYTSTSTGSVTPNVTSKSFTVSTKNTAASVTVASDGKVTFGSLGKTVQAAQSPSAIIKLTLTSNGVQGSDTGWVYQAANSSSVTYSYGAVTKGSASWSGDIPASGGTITLSKTSGSQPYTATTSWTSTATATGSSNQTVTATLYSGTTSITGSNLGCTEKSRTAKGYAIIRWVGSGGKSGSTTVSGYQAANSYITATTSYSWGTLTKGSVTWSGDIPANGGTITVSATNGQQPYTATTTNKYTASSCTSTNTGTSAITPSRTAGSASCSGSNLTTTYKCRTAKGYATYKWTGGGSKTGATTVSGYQEANVITSLDAVASTGYSTHVTYSPTSLPASGGTSTCSKHGNASLTFTSGSSIRHGSSGNYYGGTFTWSRTYKVSGSGFSIDTSNGNVTAASRGTTIGSARTGTVTSVMTVSYTPTGGCGSSKSDTMTSTITITQALNKVTSVSGTGSPSITYATIPASGGSVSPSNSGFGARFYYSSGSHGDPSGYTSKRTYSAGTGSTVLTLNTSTGAVNGPDRMSTTGVAWSRKIQTTVTYSYTNPSSVGGGSVSTSITATGTVTQQANTISYSPIQVDGPYTLGYDGSGSYDKCAQFSASMPFTYTSGDTGKTTTGFTFSSKDGQLSMTSSGYGCNMNSSYSYTDRLYTSYIYVTHSSGQEGGRTVNLEQS